MENEELEKPNFEKILNEIVEKFSLFAVFSNKVKCISLVYDLAPMLEAERKTLADLFDCGFIEELLDVNESSDEIRLTTFFRCQERFIERSGMNKAWSIEITSILGRVFRLPKPDGIVDTLIDQAAALLTAEEYEEAYNKYKLAGNMGSLDARVMFCKLILEKKVNAEEKHLIKILKEAALSNHGLAQYLLYDLHHRGEMVAKDEKQALYYLKKSAANGTPEAQYEYAFALMRGTSIEENHQLAEEYFQRAIRQDYKLAYGGLGLLYELHGKHELSKEAYCKGAEAGYYYCMRKYAEILLQSVSTVDRKHAFDLLTKASKDPMPETLFLLGKCYESGFGCTANQEKAKELYKIAAEADIPEAQYAYGNICLRSEDEQTQNHGVKQILAAAENDDESAIAFACPYLFDNISGNEVLLQSILEKGRRLKIPIAFRYSGIIYCQGIVVEKDMTRGLDYLRRAFAEGDSDAQRLLNDFSVETKKEQPKGFFKTLFKK